MSETPSYFSGTAAERMNKYARLKKQRIARQASRAFTAGALGAQHGAPVAHEWLANNPATEYERKRAQFLEMAKAGGVVQDRRLAREEQLRQDDRARDLANLSAELQKLQIEAANSRHNATLQANLQMKELQLKIAEMEKKTEELLNGNAQDRQDLRGLYQGLETSGERALERGVQGGGLPGAPGAPGAAGAGGDTDTILKGVADRALGLMDYHTMEQQGDDPGATLISADGSIPWSTFSADRAAYAAIYTAMEEAGFPPEEINANSMNWVREAGGARLQQIPQVDDTTLERAQGDRIRISEADPDKVPAFVREPSVAVGSSAGSSGGSSRAPSAAFYEDNYKDFLVISNAEFSTIADELTPEAKAALERDRGILSNNAMRAIGEKVTELSSLPDQEEARNRLMTFVNGLSDASPLSEEALWQVASQHPNGPVASYREAFQDNEAYTAQQAADLQAGVQEILDSPAAAGVNTDGVKQAMANVATSSGQAPARPGNAVDDTLQQQEEEASEAAKTQQRQEQASQDLDAQGKVMFYGMEFDKATFPQDTAGQVELLNQLIEQYPQMPAMEQARADMMADPQFAKWMESRGYQGSPQPYHFKEYQREYRIAKKMNKMQFRRQKNINKRAGITPGDLDDDRTVSGPDYEDENKALTRQDVRNYRRSSRGEAQGVREKDRKARTSKASERIAARRPVRVSTAPKRPTRPYSTTTGDNTRVAIPDSDFDE